MFEEVKKKPEKTLEKIQWRKTTRKGDKAREKHFRYRMFYIEIEIFV